MCSTCVTAFDATATNGVILVAFALNWWERLRSRFNHRSRLEREVATWEANADFMRSLDLDPLSVLGAPPAIPATSLPAHPQTEADGPPPPVILRWRQS